MVSFTTPRNRRILLSGAAGVTQRLVQLATSLITLPLVLHRLGDSGFGVWGAETSLAWAGAMLDLGLGGALITLLPRAGGQRGVSRDYVTASLFVATGISLGMLAIGSALALLWPHLAPSGPFLIAGLGLAVNIPLGLSGALWFGLQKGHVTGFWNTVQTGLTLLFVVAGVVAGAGVTVLTLVIYAAAALANAGSLIHLLWRVPELRPSPWPKFGVMRTALRSGISLSMIGAVASGAYVLDNVLALHWLGPHAAAQMAVALRVCITASGMLAVATQAFWPEFVEAVAHGDHHWVVQALGRGTLMVTMLALAGCGLLVLAGKPVLAWWLHQDLHLPHALFLAMAAWILVPALTRVAGLLLNAKALYRGQFLVQLAATALALALKPLGAKFLGVAGLLAATPLVSLFIICPAYAWMAWRAAAAPRFQKVRA